MPNNNLDNLILVGDAKLLVYEITQCIDEMIEELKNDNFNYSEYNSITSEKRKREYLAVRIAFKMLLDRDFSILYDSNGKPFLADNSYQISISHSNKWIAVIAHPTLPVGIDIECPTDKIHKIHKRFLSVLEQNELNNGNDIKQLQLAWSAKEALYKIIGIESVDFANQLRIYPFEVETKGEILAQHITSENFYNLKYIQTNAYNLVFCIA
jgi:phosphopantetheinyl transferase